MPGGVDRYRDTETPDGKLGTMYLAISDATDDSAIFESAIFESVGGKLDIHHSREYQVMTNLTLP
jgi:penicillin V acylase-like amidase (Ntn superfamily)